MKGVAVLLLVCSALVATTVGFSYQYCPGTDDRNAAINRLSISPSPATIPGQLSWDFEGVLKKPVKDVSMSLKLVRKTFLIDLTMPCVDNIGSCDYKKMCSFVDDMVRENWGGIGARIGNQLSQKDAGSLLNNDLCAVGLQPQTISKSKTIQIPQLPKLLSFLADGKYTVRLQLTDNTDNSNIICVDANFELEDNSGSIWGKRRRRSVHLH